MQLTELIFNGNGRIGFICVNLFVQIFIKL